ncbi:MAG: iron ABC transporter permease [Chloroflexia bacterium]|nr:iron ABC transporter permease [Chloroflexia bacterium]
MRMSNALTLSQPIRVMLLLGALIVGASVLSLNIGFIQLAPFDVLKTVLGQGSERQELILFQFRLPRIVLAILIGMGLAASGAILQGVSRNGLADPGLLGINAGAGLGVITLILFYPAAQASVPFLLPLAALGGAALVIYTLAYKHGEVTPSRLLLVGIAVGFGIGAVTLVFSLRMDPNVYRFAVVWLAGTNSATTWSYVLALLPWTTVLVPLTIYKAKMLNVLNLGDQVAVGLGASVEWQRRLLILIAVALAGSSVAVGGGIAFIGLVCPHLARRLVGPAHQVMLPVTLLLGALLLVVADTLARNLLAPVEIPAGIVVAVIGAPYFLYLLARTS